MVKEPGLSWTLQWAPWGGVDERVNPTRGIVVGDEEQPGEAETGSTGS